MSLSSIKRHNHRVHSCEKARKQELLQHLITLYTGKSILVISAANTTTTEIEDKNLTLSNDAELAKMDKRQWDVLISFDMPKVSEEYMSRLSHTQEIALILISEKEETLLYPIETLVGKNLPREIIPGFEPKTATVKPAAPYKPAPHRPTESQKRAELEEKEKENKKKEDFRDKKPSQRNHRYDGTIRNESEKRAEGKPQFKKSGDKKPWDKKEGDKKPWDNKSNDYRNKKETTYASSKPKRAPRVIKIPTENKSKES